MNKLGCCDCRVRGSTDCISPYPSGSISITPMHALFVIFPLRSAEQSAVESGHRSLVNYLCLVSANYDTVALPFPFFLREHEDMSLRMFQYMIDENDFGDEIEK